MSKYNSSLNLDSNSSHTKIINRISCGSKVLEFGPAHGAMTRYLKEQKKCIIYAVELDSDAAQDAKEFCADIVIDNIENYSWKNNFLGIKFDYIVFADVLEHLYDPWEVLSEVKSFLKEDGHILISLPNIANNAIIMSLMQDEFNYYSTGLLDDTHLRFFTKLTIDKMINNAGYSIINVDATFCPPYNTEFKKSYSDFNPYIIEELSKRNYGHVYQFIYEVGHKDANNIVNSDSIIEPNNIELFYDTGNGFTQENCIKYYGLKNGIIEIDCNLPIKELRFDPSHEMGKLRVNSFKVYDKYNNCYECCIKSYFGFDSEVSGELLCFTNDPQIILSTPIDNPVRLEYDMEYSKIFLSNAEISNFPNFIKLIKNQQEDLELKNRELEFKNKELKLKQEELERKEVELEIKNKKMALVFNSISWRITNPLRVVVKWVRSSIMYLKLRLNEHND